MSAERIQVEGLFDDGNAFFVLGKCKKAAAKAGWTDEQYSAFAKETRSGDFDHLIQTVMTHFEEAESDE